MNKGKAYEYACAQALIQIINTFEGISVRAIMSDAYRTAQRNFEMLKQNEPQYVTKLERAANAAINLIVRAEPKLKSVERSFSRVIEVDIQSDALGIAGDVRDVIALKARAEEGLVVWEIGISCKHNNDAVKHQRISPTIDFGEKWMDEPLTLEDFAELKRIFSNTAQDKARGYTQWNQVPDKEQRYYLPALNLILAKINSHPDPMRLARHMVAYLIGIFDFYKVIYKDGAGQGATVFIQAFNFNGTLSQASEEGSVSLLPIAKTVLPTRVASSGLVHGSRTTMEVIFDNGWQISMRIHNATTNLEKSLKMDVRLVGLPRMLFQQTLYV